MSKKENKAQRLRRLMGIDMCACGGMNTLRCEGVCRQRRLMPDGQVQCSAVYQIGWSDIKRDD